MKLLFADSLDLTVAGPLDLTEVFAALPQNKTVVDVVADYLQAIKTHFLEELSRNRGSEFWRIIDLEYSLIPAVSTNLVVSSLFPLLMSFNSSGVNIRGH